MTSTPRVFISYSWTSSPHERWVLDLASVLRKNGVDAILDKWDLDKGDDSHAFMERALTDATIGKVALICDRRYVEKANQRSGGVGTEAQIITPQLYEKTQQSKFVALVVESDEAGRACVPNYYGSRMYIDFRDPSAYSASIDELLRWIYEKPMHKKPELGMPPAYLASDSNESPTFHVQTQTLVSALREARPSAALAAQEYLDELVDAVASSGSSFTREAPIDELVVAAIEQLQLARDSYVEVLTVIVRTQAFSELETPIARFLERLLLLVRDDTAALKSTHDHIGFLAHEFFLVTLAIYLKFECFEEAGRLMSAPYYIPQLGTTVTFERFRRSNNTLKQRNQRLNLRRISLHADILSERCKRAGLAFVEVMQADFVAFMFNRCKAQDGRTYWYPETLVYQDNLHGPFEVFGRAESRSFFQRLSPALGSVDALTFKEIVVRVERDRRERPNYDYDPLEVSRLANAEKVAVRG